MVKWASDDGGGEVERVRDSEVELGGGGGRHLPCLVGGGVGEGWNCWGV